MRHDLKGGLLTLKMGLESLEDEQSLKPLLLEKTQELVELSDKLILLLRMGELNPQPVRPISLLKHAAKQAGELYPDLKVHVVGSEELDRWTVDPDAVTYAVIEVAQNAVWAKADELRIEFSESDGVGVVELRDNGDGFSSERTLEELFQLGQSSWGRAGLGLSIVESCMVGHGGALKVNEVGGDHTEIRLSFPQKKTGAN